MSDTATMAATVAATEHDVEAARIERHRRFRSNTLPALVTVGPVTLWLLAFIAVPLLYILIMGFCSTDQYYNVVYSFTLDNFQAMLDPEYLKIYGQSILIAAISTAICLGGYGAVFWMWVTAILGGASAFVESTLAQIYKRKNKDGSSYGGPSYYMETALRQRWLGVVFAIIIILTYAVGYNMLASYNLQSAFAGFSFYGDHSPFLIGLILAVLFAACVLGGAHRLTKVTGTLVPIMGVLYVVIALVVVLMHLNLVPTVFQNIFASAFDFPAIFGGFAGSCMMEGIKRGLYSNEAGMGSAPNAAATADVSHPVKQGLVQMLSVFIDTILICSATALMCLCSGVEPTAEAAGAPYVQAALQNALGDFGPVFIAISMALFAFTTLIGNYYYCEGCLRFIFKKTPSQTFMTVFRIIAAVIVLLGAVISMQLAWDTADLFQALMVVINIPVILILGRTAIKALKDYTEQRKAGKNPEFKAANIGLKEKTDYWN